MRPLGEVRFDPYVLIAVLQVINLAAICTPADYNTRPLDTIYSNFVDALPVVQYCRENGKRLIHFSTCEVYGKTIGSFLPKDSPLKKVGHTANASSVIFAMRIHANSGILGSGAYCDWMFYGSC